MLLVHNRKMLKKRMEVGLVEVASVTTRKRDYATFRRMLDENTRSMCRTIKEKRKKNEYEDIDDEAKELLKGYIEVTPFEDIRVSTDHKKRVDQLTFKTKSNRACYWCLSDECLHKRRFHTTLENIGRSRSDLEWLTIHTCPVYSRKIEQALRRA